MLRSPFFRNDAQQHHICSTSIYIVNTIYTTKRLIIIIIIEFLEYDAAAAHARGTYDDDDDENTHTPMFSISYHKLL
jgi:hypothetical protein